MIPVRLFFIIQNLYICDHLINEKKVVESGGFAAALDHLPEYAYCPVIPNEVRNRPN